MKYYPAFLDLKNQKVVVVGGGKVAERKVRSLIKAGAAVRVISPAITAGLEKLRKKRAIIHTKRNYKKGDLKDAFLVIAGTSSSEINSQIARDSGHLVNVVDSPSNGNFIVPSVVRRGPLTIAVSTEGASPAASKTIRKEIESRYGSEFTRYLRFVEQIRVKAMEKITDAGKRKKFLKSLASQKVLDNFRDKGFSACTIEILTALEKQK